MFIKNVKILVSLLLVLMLAVGLFPYFSYADDNIAQLDITKAFKDGDFLAIIKNELGKKSHERVYSYEVAQIKSLSMSPYTRQPKSLEGLQWLEGLESLSYGGSPMDKKALTSIDLSGCKNLKKLYLGHHKIDSLDLSKNIQLEELSLNALDISKLDTSKNIKLKTLKCTNNNSLTKLDLSKNTELKTLKCNYNNSLTKLDLSKNTKLETLDCSFGNFPTLDISKNLNLKTIECMNSKISNLTIPSSNSLTVLKCSGNKLTTLDLSKATGLKSLECGYSHITSLDLQNNLKLERLHCLHSELTKLELGIKPSLVEISCSYNNLSDLDVSKCPNLKELTLSNNKLNRLNIRNNPNLAELIIWSNLLTELDVSQNPKLTYLSCSSNYLSSEKAIKGLKNKSLYETYIFDPQSSVPSAPRHFFGAPGGGKAYLSWSPPVYVGKSPITRYEISADGGKNWTDVGNTNSYTFENLTGGKDYYFLARAVNGQGSGLEAQTMRVTPQYVIDPPGQNVISLPGQNAGLDISGGLAILMMRRSLNFDTRGGSAIDTVSAFKGSIIDLTEYESIKAGYDFDGWHKDAGLSQKITSLEIEDNTTVYAKWKITEKIEIIEIIEEEPEIIEIEEEAFYTQASDWAVPELTKAKEADLIPDILMGKDMIKTISREEFAELAVRLYEESTGKPIEVTKPNPFTDTSNPQILKAYQVGITAGTSVDKFSPNVLISREQCATMLYRAIQAISPKANYSIAGVPDFPDQKHIADWAVEGTKYMSKLGIILGNTQGEFMPKPLNDDHRAKAYGMSSREAAVLMSIRTFEKID